MPLFAEFDQATYLEWKNQAQAELKGGSFEEKLPWATPEGFTVEPYVSPDVASQPWGDYLAQCLAAEHPGWGKPWRNRLQIPVTDEATANQLALHYLSRGIDEVAFDLTARPAANVNLGVLLKDISLPHCGISFIAGAGADVLAAHYETYARAQGYEVASLTGSIEVAGLPSGSPLPTEISLGLLKFPAPGFAPLDLQTDQRAVTDALAHLLAQADELITALAAQGATPATVIPKLQFTRDLGNHYFLEIAGLRALRLLFSDLARQHGLAHYHPGLVRVHARTRPWATGPEADANQNLLSNTTQAMSAVIGGCNVLTVLPHQPGASPDLGLRVAANISNLLDEESHLGKVADPSAGSFYIEQLTEQVMEAAWAKWQQRQG
ncbi:MAG: methylmalonyl-CoA mutase family protein [Bernardetiaceae bacterium]|jgi:methylmalonyl-CoA mutase|nr:methylmalonyl-CoA mutase family protein [Bernardetiaceae bacterium]